MYFELNRIFLFNLKNIVCEGVVWDCVFRLKTKFVFVYLGGGGVVWYGWDDDECGCVWCIFGPLCFELEQRLRV